MNFFRRKTADKDYIEYFECEVEMSEELYQQYLNVERIICYTKSPDRPDDVNDYYVKWCCLPYSDCTWEEETLLAKKWQHKIDEFYARIEFDCLPLRHNKHGSARAKFTQLKEQPSYLGGGNEDCVLRDYQLDGVNWLIHSWCK